MPKKRTKVAGIISSESILISKIDLKIFMRVIYPFKSLTFLLASCFGLISVKVSNLVSSTYLRLKFKVVLEFKAVTCRMQPSFSTLKKTFLKVRQKRYFQYQMTINF